MRENMPLLLTESLDPARRELTHQHIETCPMCVAEWSAYKETWSILDTLPELDVPARVKQRFLAEVSPAVTPNVVPFRRRSAPRWLAQAAAAVIIAGGAFYGGHRMTPRVELTPTPATLVNVQPAPFYSIAESRVLPAASISPQIEGRPDIQNVQFTDASPSNDQIGVSFDITSHVTVTGRPTDKSMVRLLRYVLENEDKQSPSRSRAIDWVRSTYAHVGNPDPEITEALANVLRNDDNQGVRIKAADTLRSLQSTMTDGTRDALVEALKNDPNPAVRLKAVEALAKLARSGGNMDPDMVDTLRKKASQGDENVYVRVKAAEALSSIQPK
ncbi:MAG: HEAT repeat domain-containing protein [Acidobacteria bacterium]|nr:HEAT repeat domain-containing protein [Acidobacteriota bacterium]MBV9187431.1 HEAT repeat domain-containing protein [Acidobacteriota bacterium]